ncbi:hypothetical protein HPB50_022685 [Hyalomma asiaticum]|uniref:Uncharacterized protein n=1 Tax=Hyalomma asiaticum TaxID=266040 RepID=A0ACB7T401_HYAAI|nr:hypothetical protein HPB50_022685 [Hyalomma asiaticum]
MTAKGSLPSTRTPSKDKKDTQHRVAVLYQGPAEKTTWHLFVNSADATSDKVRLKDVQALTLRLGQYTTGRRSHPVPQLNCRGGSAGCRDQPSVVQCYNRGTDGRDVQWECKTEMKRSQKFGLIQVTCEGYDYPQDEYILVGSCGLEYYLERTGHGRRSSLPARGQRIYKERHSSARRFPSFVSAIFVVLAALGFCALCLCCVSVCDDASRPGSTFINRLKRSQRRYQPLQAPLQSTNQLAARPSVPPPAYQTYETPPPYNPQYMPTGQAPNINYGWAPTMWPASSSGGPGFWTGAATGGLLGYLYGNRGTRGQRIYKERHSSARRFPSFVSAIFVVLAALGFCALCLCCVSVCDDASRPGSTFINRLKRSQRRYQPLQAPLQSTNQLAARPSVPPPAYQTYETPPPYNPQYMPTGQAPNINYAYMYLAACIRQGWLRKCGPQVHREDPVSGLARLQEAYLAISTETEARAGDELFDGVESSDMVTSTGEEQFWTN